MNKFKLLVIFFFLFLGFNVLAQPGWRSFNTNQFGTNGGFLRIKTGAPFTNAQLRGVTSVVTQNVGTIFITNNPFMFNTTNSSTLWISTNGVDATAIKGRSDLPWKTVYDVVDGTAGTYTGAITNAVAGDTIVFLPGVHEVSYIPLNRQATGLNMVLMPGATLTRVTSGSGLQANINDGGPLIIPGHNSQIYLWGNITLGTNGYDAAIGWWDSLTTTAFGSLYGFTNRIATNVFISGGSGIMTGPSDVFYFVQTNTIQSSVTVDNMIIRSGWDCFRGNGNLKLSTRNLDVFSTNTVSPGQSRGLVLDQGVTWEDQGSKFGASGGTNQNYGVFMDASTGTFQGTRFYTTGTNFVPIFTSGGAIARGYWMQTENTVIASNFWDAANVKFWVAKGDGVTDDTVSIQNAINAAALAGGGTVIVPPGTFLLGDNGVYCLQLTNNITLQGSGKYSTILKRKNDSSGNPLDLITATNAHDVVIQDIGLDGNRGLGTENWFGVNLRNCTNSVIRNSSIKGFQHTGITINSGRNNTVETCELVDWGDSLNPSLGFGIALFNGTSGNKVLNNVLLGTNAYGFYGVGIDAGTEGGGGADCYENQVIGNRISGTSVGILVEDSTRNRVAGNIISAVTNGIIIETGQDLRMPTRNIVSQNSISSLRGTDQRAITCNGQDNTIDGNKIFNVGNNQGIALLPVLYSTNYIGLNSDNKITHNTIDSCSVGIFLNSGSGHVVSENTIKNVSGDGVRLETNSNETNSAPIFNIQLLHNYVANTTNGRGVYVVSGSGNITDVLIDGTIARNIGIASTADAVFIDQESNLLARVTVLNTSAYDDQTSPTTRYAVNAYAASLITNLVVSGINTYRTTGAQFISAGNVFYSLLQHTTKPFVFTSREDAPLRVARASLNADFGIEQAGANYGLGLWFGGVGQAVFYDTGLTLGSYIVSGFDAPTGGLIASGAVGIGNPAPAAKLDVTGDIRASTTVTATNGFLGKSNVVFHVPTNAPTGNQVVTASGTTGITRWADAAGGANFSTNGSTGDAAFYNNVAIAGTVTVGGGTPVVRFLSASATLNFPDTSGGTSSDLTITVAGAGNADVVSIGVGSDGTSTVGTNGLFFGWVSSNDTVTVRYVNNNVLTSYNPLSETFRAMVTKF